MNRLLLTTACLGAMVACQQASAVQYTFSNITGTSAVNAAAGSAQLTVDVTDATVGSSPKVAFKFDNTGPNAMSITKVLWDDGTLLSIGSITDSGGGVDFSQGGNDNLPGGNGISPAFITTAGFVAASDPPVQPSGVNPGEWLTVTFNLQSGKTFAQTLAALDGPLGDGSDLRIGIHVQGFGDGGSESFINSVPDGGTTAALLGLGMLGIGFVARRKA